MYTEFCNNNIENHISCLAADKVTEICQPLFKTFDLNYFGYGRIYSDNSVAILNTDREWNKCFHKNKYHRRTSITYDKGIHLGSTYLPSDFISNLANNFNHHSHINIARKFSDYVEFFNFTAATANSTIIEYFFNHIDLIDNFLLYFKDKASLLIKEATEERFLFVKPTVLCDASEIMRQEFIAATKIQHLQLHYQGNDIVLTGQEYKVLSYLVSGKTIKEIAHILNISPRTVELHIENAKKKSHCGSKRKLLEILKNNLLRQI